VLQKAGRAQSV